MPLSGFSAVTSIRADSCGDGEPSLGVRFLFLAASGRRVGGGGRKLGAGNKSGKISVCAINPPRVQAPQLIISDGLFASQTMRCDFQPHELGGRAKKMRRQRARLYLIYTVKEQTRRRISRVFKIRGQFYLFIYFFLHHSYETLTQTRRWNLTFQSRVVSLSLRAHPNRPAGARPMESNVSSPHPCASYGRKRKRRRNTYSGQTPTLSSPPPAGSGGRPARNIKICLAGLQNQAASNEAFHWS